MSNATATTATVTPTPVVGNASILHTRVKESIAAAMSGIWLRSYEHEFALTVIADVCKANGWQMLTWDPERSIQKAGQPMVPPNPGVPAPGPVTSIELFRQEHAAINKHKKESDNEDDEFDNVDDGNGDTRRCILVMRNLHPLLTDATGNIHNPQLLQALQHVIEDGASAGMHTIILSYEGIALPRELEKMVTVIDHDLPTADELWDILTFVEDPANLPARNTQECQLLLDAAAGLTRMEASSAFSLSIARHGSMEPQTLWELKSGMLKKNGLLEMVKPRFNFAQVGGLNGFKTFCMRAIKSPNRSRKCQAKGVLSIGLPGTGKSMSAEALAAEIGWPLLKLDIGSMFDKYIGGTEDKIRRALKTVDAMAPCILFIDELEKALAGAGGGSQDSGVSDRMFGTLLTWLNDHQTEVFTIGTCNDPRALISVSQGAFVRSGRFDAIFFVDLPGEEQKQVIWDIWVPAFQLDPDQPRPKADKWTGADINSCCRLARLLDVSLVEAAEQVVPVADTADDQISGLRDWAHKRCLAADWVGVYDKNGEPKYMAEAQIDVDNRPKRRAITRNPRK